MQPSWQCILHLGWLPVATNKPKKKKVDEVFSLVIAGHCSLLASLGDGGYRVPNQSPVSKHIIEVDATSVTQRLPLLSGQLTGKRDADRLGQHVRCSAFLYMLKRLRPATEARSNFSPALFALCFSHPTPARLILFSFSSLCAASKASAWRRYSTNNEKKKEKKKLHRSPETSPV